MLEGIWTSYIYKLLYTPQNVITSISLYDFYLNSIVFVGDYKRCGKKKRILWEVKKLSDLWLVRWQVSDPMIDDSFPSFITKPFLSLWVVAGIILKQFFSLLVSWRLWLCLSNYHIENNNNNNTSLPTILETHEFFHQCLNLEDFPLLVY